MSEVLVYREGRGIPWSVMLKPIVFTRHALDNLGDRGATRDEVEEAIRLGEQIPAKHG